MNFCICVNDYMYVCMLLTLSLHDDDDHNLYRDNGGRDDSRRRSSSRKDDGIGRHRSSKDRHHSRTRESDSERDIYPSETSEAINDDGGGGSRPRSHRDNRHHSSKHSSSKHRREHHRPQERIYENGR